jgi:hypothetical protein
MSDIDAHQTIVSAASAAKSNAYTGEDTMESSPGTEASFYAAADTGSGL